MLRILSVAVLALTSATAANVDHRGSSLLLRGSEDPELRVSGDGIDHVAAGFDAGKLFFSLNSSIHRIHQMKTLLYYLWPLV